MPWRRFRKKVERPIDVSKSIEESLEDAADGESEEDATELAELDDANITETESGEADDSRAPTDLGERLRDALATEEQRGGLPSERPLARGASRSHEGPSEGDPRAATSGARSGSAERSLVGASAALAARASMYTVICWPTNNRAFLDAPIS